MFSFLSLVTSVKDYVEVVHKFVETDPSSTLINYENFGAILSYLILSTKNCFMDVISFNWLNQIWSLPITIPEISSSMLSEISVLDNYFHNLFTFLDTPLSYGTQNSVLYCLEKFSIGLINSFFLFLPTSTSHLITLRRFVMQGIEAGYIAGLGTIAGNLLWIASILFGWRFIVIPWLSFDTLRYILGFVLLVKYMWDSYNEKKLALEDLSKMKIFLLSFLLSFTEQTTIFPFVTNLSIGSEATVLESFPVDNFVSFLTIHSSYLGGLFIGSLSLLHLSCWFFDNPAFNIYTWIISSFKVTTNVYSKFLNFFFLYLTMICAVSNFAYFGLDYTVTNSLGFVHEDRLIEQKALLETSFLSTKASDRNTRRNRGRHGRRERWKRRIRKYRTFDASLYDQTVYDLFPMEDLNYGFDRFWLRRKMRNHRVRFRFFPGPWMRSFKKQLATPRLESFMGPRVEFFRMLFEQVYHPSFHERSSVKKDKSNLNKDLLSNSLRNRINSKPNYLANTKKSEFAAIRKFIRKFQTRIQIAKTKTNLNAQVDKSIYSKRWTEGNLKMRNYNQIQFKNNFNPNLPSIQNSTAWDSRSNMKLNKKELQMLRYRDFLSENSNQNNIYQAQTFLHPAKFYLQREKAFRKKLRYYGTNLFRNFGIENNAPYFRVLMRKYFYYYKPTLRWKRTMHNASLRKALRQKTRKPRRFKESILLRKQLETTKQNLTPNLSNNKVQTNLTKNDSNHGRDKIRHSNINSIATNNWNNIQKPTHWYSVVGKRASRYRSQIYKDVLQHWYYSPFNRFFLKFDIDSFIRRQPVSHFLTKKEEYLLHLRRFLLSEHYESLRWYTYMQHYQTMKNQIGGTKSFSSRTYNQQFQGTFKKVRHLFALTPNQEDKTILKFDQTLFNEYSNKLTNSNYLRNRINSLISDSFLHEELLSVANGQLDENNNPLITNGIELTQKSLGQNTNSLIGTDLITDSKNILKQYMLEAQPIRKKMIQNFLDQKNYSELSKFLLKGQKTRGEKAVTGNQAFLNQEAEILLNKTEKNDLLKSQKEKFKNLIKARFKDDFLWLLLLKKAQTQIYDQESLKYYFLRRLEKREKRQDIFEKNLKLRLQRLEKWFQNNQNILKKITISENPKTTFPLVNSLTDSNLLREQLDKNSNFEANLKTGIQKAFKEVLIFQKDYNEFPNDKLESSKSYRSNWSLAKSKYHFNSFKLKNYLKKNVKENIQSLQKIEDNIYFKLSEVDKTPIYNSLITKIQGLFGQTTRLVSKRFQNLSNLTTTDKFNIMSNVESWRKNEIALTKRKRSRKRFKRLKKKQVLNLQTDNRENVFLNSFDLKSSKLVKSPDEIRELQPLKQALFAKSDNSNSKVFRAKVWNQWLKSIDRKWSSEKPDSLQFKSNISMNEINCFSNLIDGSVNQFKNSFQKKFKMKRSRRRGSSKMRQRSAIRKNTFKQSLRRRRSRKYSANQVEKGNLLEKLANVRSDESLTSTNLFTQNIPKYRRLRQRKNRYWKKSKRPKYAQTKRKLKKNKRSSINRLRNYNKQLKRIESNAKVKGWWSNVFLPRFQTLIENQILDDRLTFLNEKLQTLSSEELMSRNALSLKISQPMLNSDQILEIGNLDYKPLAMPQAVSIQKNQSQLGSQKNSVDDKINDSAISEQSNFDKTSEDVSLLGKQLDKNLIHSFYQNLLAKNQKEMNNEQESRQFIVNMNYTPFYAGWDETLRKFVITNRLLSRRNAGYEMNIEKLTANKYKSFQNLPTLFEFTKAPLRGMNAATTLYWQIPFTTYDPDQFFALGMDGFSPIAWKRFNFRHMKQTIKPMLIQNLVTSVTDPITLITNRNRTEAQIAYTIYSIHRNKAKAKTGLSTKLNQQLISQKYQNRDRFLILENDSAKSTEKNKLNQIVSLEHSEKQFKKQRARRLVKRYRRVKKHPKPPVWFPAGPLTQEVLPVHYIYVFYKRFRLPRDRYIRRRLRKNKDGLTLGIQENTSNRLDYTLRRRVKPRRRYHRSRPIRSGEILLPRRKSFISLTNQTESTRPISKARLNSGLQEFVFSKSKFERRRKLSNIKDQRMNMRIRQLRRRVQRQVIRPINWRYKPRPGGIVWPGDYLRLEAVGAPRLNSKLTLRKLQTSIENVQQKKTKRKKKRMIQEWQIQPKKYLIQKHNLKVLKKRLEKSQNLNQLTQKVHNLKFLLQKK